MARSKIETFVRKFGRLIARNANRIEIVVLKEVQGLMLRRIFNDGLDVAGRQIGKYSTRPILVGAKTFTTKKAADSFFGRKNLQWRRVRTKKTKKLVNLAIAPGGYKQVRQIGGFRTDRVDLQYRGDLIGSIIVAKSGSDNVIGFETDEQRKIGRANEIRFKGAERTIFGISATEQKAADIAVLKELDAIIAKNFR